MNSGMGCEQWNRMWTVEQSVGSGMECGQWNGMWMKEQSKNSEKEFK